MLRDMSHQSDIMGDLDCNDHVDSEAVQYVMTEAMEVNSPEPGKNNSEAMSVFSVEGHLVRLSQSSLFGHGSIKSLQWSHHDSTRSRIASMVTVGTKSTMSCEMPAPGGLPMDRELAEHRQQENGSALRVRHRVFVKSLNRDILPKCGDMDANRVDLVKKMLQVYSIEADSDLLLHSIIYGAMLHVLPGLRRADSCTQGEKDEFVMISGYLGETQQWLCRPVFKSHRKYGRTALPVQICKPVLSRMEYWRLYNREIQVMLGQAGLS
nr:hypothetical protein B0A51_18858 [Rachicladosporium sp. CCFEE 5018]